MSALRVMILEDDPVTASVYEEYLRRIPGVEHARTAGTRAAALAFLVGRWRVYADFGVDLLLVDMNLPDGHGLDVLRHLRSAGWPGGAVALTAASDRQVVRAAVALGMTDYLLKPFTFEEFAARVGGYRELSLRLGASGEVPDQAQLDQIFNHDTPRGVELPKGLTPETLTRVSQALAASGGEHQPACARPSDNQVPEAARSGRAAGGALSATELGQLTGLSRVTARRYLEHLVDTGQASRQVRHGTPGRPEVEYSAFP